MNSRNLDQDALPRGTVIAGHQIERVIGRGGFGRTYLVRDQKNGSPWVLKEYHPKDFAERVSGSYEIRPKYGDEMRFRSGHESFFSEAKHLYELPEQRNVVGVKGLFTKFGTAYMLMEHIDGVALTAYKRQRASIGEKELIRTLRRIGRGLSHLHNYKLLHRDIKPDNIMVTQAGEPVLIDFGAARVMTEGGQFTSILTPAYAPIEQHPEVKSLELAEGPWTDIYALGVIAYEFGSGDWSRPPSALDRYNAVQSGKRDPYTPLRASARSAEFRRAVDWALALYPDGRPGQISDWIESLEGADRKDVSVHPDWSPPPRPRAVVAAIAVRRRAHEREPTLEQRQTEQDLSGYEDAFTDYSADAPSASRRSGLLPNALVFGGLAALVVIVAIIAVLVSGGFFS